MIKYSEVYYIAIGQISSRFSKDNADLISNYLLHNSLLTINYN